jgi:hypothetical protein
MVAGYAAYAPPSNQIPPFAFTLLTANGDIGDGALMTLLMF